MAWGEKYHRCIPRFKRSLERYGIPHRIVEIGGEPRHVMEARRFKPTIILDWMEKVGSPVSWVDVDSEVLEYPAELDGWAGGDIRACKPEGSYRWWSNCISFSSSKKSVETLERWQELLADRDWPLDEEALLASIQDVKPTIVPLSESYVWCEPWMRPIHADGRPVILHGGISKETWDTEDWEA